MVDAHELERRLDALPGGLESLPSRDLLRLGSVWLAHARVSEGNQSRWLARARKAFTQVVAHDSDAGDQRVARFNLALLALAEGDEEAARTGLEAAGEQDRNLALVSPRFALVTPVAEVYLGAARDLLRTLTGLGDPTSLRVAEVDGQRACLILVWPAKQLMP